MTRLLISPGTSFKSMLYARKGSFGDVLAFVLLVALCVNPVQTGRSVLAFQQSVMLGLSKLLSQFIDFVIGPMAICMLAGLALAVFAKTRKINAPVDGIMTAAVHLWVPVGLISIFGAVLFALGLGHPIWPNTPWRVFFQAKSNGGQVALRLALSYGPSLLLFWKLAKTLGEKRPYTTDKESLSRWRWALAGCLLAGWISGGVYAATHSESILPIKAGDRAKVFRLPRLDLPHHFRLEETPKPVVIEFWAEWCSVCVKHMPAFDQWAKAHPEVSALAIHQGGDKKSVGRLIKKMGWRHLLFLLDAYSMTSKAYKVDNLPTFVVIDKNKNILASHMGKPPPGWLERQLAP
jgi:thiol-disulfide isomerase/thioredoxin